MKVIKQARYPQSMACDMSCRWRRLHARQVYSTITQHIKNLSHITDCGYRQWLQEQSSLVFLMKQRFTLVGRQTGTNAMCYRKWQSDKVNVQSAITRKVTAPSLFEEDTPPAPAASICHDKTQSFKLRQGYVLHSNRIEHHNSEV